MSLKILKANMALTSTFKAVTNTPGLIIWRIEVRQCKLPLFSIKYTKNFFFLFLLINSPIPKTFKVSQPGNSKYLYRIGINLERANCLGSGMPDQSRAGNEALYQVLPPSKTNLVHVRSAITVQTTILGSI